MTTASVFRSLFAAAATAALVCACADAESAIDEVLADDADSDVCWASAQDDAALRLRALGGDGANATLWARCAHQRYVDDPDDDNALSSAVQALTIASCIADGRYGEKAPEHRTDRRAGSWPVKSRDAETTNDPAIFDVQSARIALERESRLRRHSSGAGRVNDVANWELARAVIRSPLTLPLAPALLPCLDLDAPSSAGFLQAALEQAESPDTKRRLAGALNEWNQGFTEREQDDSEAFHNQITQWNALPGFAAERVRFGAFENWPNADGKSRLVEGVQIGLNARYSGAQLKMDGDYGDRTKRWFRQYDKESGDGRGEPTAKDAVTLVCAGAAKKSVHALAFLAEMYLGGYGVAEDPIRANFLLREAKRIVETDESDHSDHDNWKKDSLLIIEEIKTTDRNSQSLSNLTHSERNMVFPYSVDGLCPAAKA